MNKQDIEREVMLSRPQKSSLLDVLDGINRRNGDILELTTTPDSCSLWYGQVFNNKRIVRRVEIDTDGTVMVQTLKQGTHYDLYTAQDVRV